MYLFQTIDVNVTKENADILKRPSKVFNSIKTVFQGGMTPTEQRQSEVMLCILQRLNVALRQSQFDNLASVAVNDATIYESSQRTSLEESNQALEAGFSSGKITKVNTLALTADSIKGDLHYLIHVSIVRKPKVGIPPISVQIFGFIDEFKREEDENDEVFSTRVKQAIKKSWGSKKKRKTRLLQLENKFEEEVLNLQAKIDSLFPSKSTSTKAQRTIKKQSFKSKNIYHNDRYDNTYLYLPYFYENIDEKQYKDEGFVIDKFESWDNDGVYTDSTDKSSSGWGGFEFSDSSSDSVSSCGSSCGGGCGGS